MTATTTRGPIKALVVVTYIAMVAVNYLANALPLNGRRTGEVSDAYPSLFTPAGLTFSIWGVIYLLLALHVLYQLGLFRGGERSADRDALLVDTLNGHFDNFYLEMQQPYDDWRRSRLEEIDNVRELESQANQPLRANPCRSMTQSKV